jgi:hypothetical protein
LIAAGVVYPASDGDAGMSKKKQKNPHWGSTLDDFLHEDGTRENVRTEAATRVVAWQITQTSRALVDLTEEEIEEMTSGRMSSEHDHLNALLEEE